MPFSFTRPGKLEENAIFGQLMITVRSQQSTGGGLERENGQTMGD